MPQFILIAYDATDEGALERRMATREAHIASINEWRAKGHILCGLAITDDADKMIGSVVVTDFPSREEFDHWLNNDPYVIGNVWEEKTILNGKLGPSFNDLIRKG